MSCLLIEWKKKRVLDLIGTQKVFELFGKYMILTDIGLIDLKILGTYINILRHSDIFLLTVLDKMIFIAVYTN